MGTSDNTKKHDSMKGGFVALLRLYVQRLNNTAMAKKGVDFHDAGEVR